jgi:hypothetical protein
MTTRTERTVRRSNLDWVIVRPVILTNEPKTNAYRALVDPLRWTCVAKNRGIRASSQRCRSMTPSARGRRGMLAQELRTPGAAAQTRMVSVAGIRLDPTDLCDLSKG